MSKKKPVVSANDKRKPPSAAERARFVAATSEVTPRDREKLTIYVDREVLTSLRVFCARSRQELSEVTTAALSRFLAEQQS